MQPIWNEQIRMWHDLGVNIPVCEGVFWINNQVIKAYDLETGDLCNLYRIKVNDDLTMSYKKHADFAKHRNKNFETWEETAARHATRINALEQDSIALLREAAERYPDYEHIVLTSTGKDSAVVENIAKLSGFLSSGQLVFNNTTMDVSDTYKIVRKNGYTTTNPPEGFYQYIDRVGFIPTRFSRGCCTIFKEGNFRKAFEGCDKLLIASGVRNSESANRAEYEDYTHNPKYPTDWISVLPIRKYTDEDVWLYIISRNLEINPKYKKGYQRVGCAIACPYYIKTTWVLDKYWYPRSYQRWHNILDASFVAGERWTKLNCTQAEFHSCWSGGLLRKEATPEVIAEFAAHKGLDDMHLAAQYFNRACCLCSDASASKNVRQPEVVAMNLKLFGRNSKSMMCKKHLMASMNWGEEDWQRSVAEFKDEGCDLF